MSQRSFLRHSILAAAASLSWLIVSACESSAAVDSAQLEYSVKAAYLYKFGGFVEWPQTAFAAPDSPTNLCILGSDPFGALLDKVVDGQHIGDHPIVVKRLEKVEHQSGCQILFVGGADDKKTSQALEAVRGESVLTITDGARTPQATGIINFVIADNRVRFEIDDQAAAANGVVISSKLLDLARSAKRRG